MSVSLPPLDCVVCQAPLSSSVSWSWLKVMSTESVMLSDHLILCHLLLLSPSVFPSIRAFSNELALHIRWPKCWSFNNNPSKEYSGLISFRIVWFSSCRGRRKKRIQGILKSLLQHNSKASEDAYCINLLSFDDFDENDIHPNHLNKKEN